MDLRYDIEEYKDMRFPVASVKENKSIFNEIPELKRYKEFQRTVKFHDEKGKEAGDTEKKKDLPKGDVMRYVALVYDKKSPYQEEKNINRRKFMVAKDIGWGVDKDGRFRDVRVDKIVRLMSQDVNRMIVRYVRLQNDLGYARLVAGLELYYDNLKKVAENTGDDALSDNATRSKLNEALEKNQLSLESLAEEVFSGDEQGLYIADEINQEEKGEIVSYPEYIANLRDSGEF